MKRRLVKTISRFYAIASSLFVFKERTRATFLEAEIKAKDELIATLRENLSDLRTPLQKSDELIASTITQKRLGWFDSMFGKRG